MTRKPKPRTKAKKPGFKYKAFRFAQTAKKSKNALVIFHAPVEEVLKWSQVGVLTPTTSGHQRERRDAKVKAIDKFLDADVRNVIPTAIIVAFTKTAVTFTVEDDDSGLGTLAITASPASANIVDGQHRVYGIEQHDPNGKVPIVGLLQADQVEKAFHFLVINNKSTKVPANHTKAVLADLKDTKLVDRLRAARMAFDSEGIRDVDVINSDADSPFHQSINWSITAEDSRMIQATAIEASLAYLGGLSVPELEDRDVRRSFFLAVWKAIKDNWEDIWTTGSRLTSKVGIVCLTRFVADMITTWADSEKLEIDILDLEKIEEVTKEIVAEMDTQFWTQPWAEKAAGGFDTNQGRDRVVAALTRLYRNGKRKVAWYTDIDIIEPVKT